MRNLVSLLSVILLFIGCSWGSLLENELTGSDSVPSESLDTSGVLPPSGIKGTIAPENSAYTVLITWDSVANAKEYEIAITGDYSKTEKVEVSQYKFPVSLAKGDSFTASVTLKTINVNGKVSAKSAPLVISFGSDSVYSESVHDFYASRGTETSVLLTYTPAKGADRYKLERRLTGTPDDVEWELISAGIVNADSSASLYRYYDQTAVGGYCYDYRITPVDAGGIAGTASVTEAGFVWPLARDLRAGQGGEGFYEDNKGVFAVEWDIQSELLGYGGEPIDSEVYPELKEIMKGLSFQFRVAAGASQLDDKDANFASDWNYSAGIASFSNYDGSNLSKDFTPERDEFADASMSVGGAKIYKKSEGYIDTYRLYVIVNGAGHADDNPIWGKKGYLQVRSSYDKYPDLPWSNKASGYVVSSTDAEIWKDGKVFIIDYAPNAVKIEWTGGDEGSVFQGWSLYIKKEGEAEFSQLEGYDFVEGIKSTEIRGLAAGSYWFGVAGSDGSGNTGIIYESGKVTVAADAVDEPEPVPEPEPEPGA